LTTLLHGGLRIATEIYFDLVILFEIFIVKQMISIVDFRNVR